MPSRFRPHEIEWTPEKGQRLWDWISSSDSYQTNNFGRLAADNLIKFVRQRKVPLTGIILDYGCGPGFFLEELLQQGLSCEGAENSSAATQQARGRLRKYAGFGGVTEVRTIPTSLSSNKYGLVFLLETIEHFMPSETERTINELHRVLRPDGFLCVSTPNDENIEAGKIICPDCGSIFHKGQHLSCWTTRSLEDLMVRLGFTTITCEATTLRSPSRLNFLRNFASILQKQKKLNLVYLGQKKK